MLPNGLFHSISLHEKKLPYICLPVDNKHGLICVMLCVAAAVMNVSALMFLLYFSVLSITTELF